VEDAQIVERDKCEFISEKNASSDDKNILINPEKKINKLHLCNAYHINKLLNDLRSV
jgi:hypothetical protein